MLDEQAVIHPVELVTGEDQIFINIPFLKQPLIFTNCIRCSLKPGRTVRCLLGSKNLNKSAAEGVAEIEGMAEMTIE